jgi:hypothetical protein
LSLSSTHGYGDYEISDNGYGKTVGLKLMKNIMDMEVRMVMDMVNTVDMGDCMVDIKDMDMKREMVEDLEWVDMVGGWLIEMGLAIYTEDILAEKNY